MAALLERLAATVVSVVQQQMATAQRMARVQIIRHGVLRRPNHLSILAVHRQGEGTVCH